MDKIAVVLSGVSALVLAIATTALGVTLPAFWAMQSDMGGAKVRLEMLDKRVESMDGKLDALIRTADGITARLAQRDTDPSVLIAQAGLRPSTEFAGARVGSKLYVLPKTDEAQLELANLGLRREAITPSTFGYVLGGWSDDGVLRLSTGTVPAGTRSAPPGPP